MDRRYWYVAALVLVLGGCGSAGSSADDGLDPGPPATDGIGGTYVAEDPAQVDATDHALVEGSRIELTLEGRDLGVHAGCNHLSGEARIVDDVLRVTALAGTEMACPDALMAQDRWLADFLTSAPRVELDEDVLVLTGSGSVLRLDRAEDRPHPGTADPDRPTSAPDTGSG